MLLLKWLSVLALTAFAASAGTDVPELVIDKTHVPSDCKLKSQKGDKIRVHYVSNPEPSPLVSWLTVTEFTDRKTPKRQ